MDQFVNPQQITYYDLSRPKYTQEIFEDIIKSTKSFNSYLDIACGTGQLLLPLSSNFKISIGIDVSEAQINKTKENIQKGNIQQEIHLFTCDAYEIHKNITNIIPDSKFDLITIGQAFHWFEEDKILKYLKSLLKDNGVLILAGYSKEHFEELEQPELYHILSKTISKLLPYFKFDVENNDKAYYKSHQSIKKIFESEIITKHHRESADLPLNNLFNLLRSWSAYNNFKKSDTSNLSIKEQGSSDTNTKITDPIEDLESSLSQFFNLPLDELNSKKVKYYNFYYTLTIYNN